MSKRPYAVLIICFNQERYVGNAIESVLHQTAIDHVREIVVVDDCSVDRSVEIANRYATRDPRITVISRMENSGGCAAPRNDGIANTSAPWIAFLDGDDLWVPEKVENELLVLRAHPDVGLLFSDHISFDDGDGTEKVVTTRHYEAGEAHQLERFFIYGGPVVPSGAVISRAAVDAVGVFDPMMKFNEDSEMWMRIVSEFPIHHINKPLLRKREWFGSLGSPKYGLENIAAKHEITRRMLERIPSLRAVASKRESQIELKTAVHHFSQYDLSAARRHLRKALAEDPSNRKARVYLALSRLPGSPEAWLNMGRRLRNATLARFR